ncbi:Tyrosine ammonia-lyase [compost metagenome]
MDSKFNGGLPSNLSGASGERCMINHGFKAVQIGVSAWTAEALKLTMPASVFSRSTECHNQDKVSMGTIAARDALRVLTLSEQVGAACLLAAVQGVELSLGARQCDLETLSQPLRETILAVRADHPPLVEDRPLEQELRALIARLQERHYQLYGEPKHVS